jgi:ribosomal protein S18 acetylase RimI-like enzyme
VHVVRHLDHREPAVADEIVRVQRAAYRVEADLIGFDGIPPLHETDDEVVALDLTVFGVRDETGLLVGLLGYSRDGDRVTIDRLAIEPACHRQGIARSLLEDLHRREHVESVEVSTGAANTPALRLYHQLGYRSVRRDRLAEGITVERLARAGRNPR